MGKKQFNIKVPDVPTSVSITKNANTNDVFFSFKHLSRESYTRCRDCSFFIELLQRFQKLSLLGWKEIRQSHRHSWGMEKMPVNQIKHDGTVSRITPDVRELDVFRASGDNRVLVGLQEQQVFNVFFIEANFGDISNH